MNKLIPLLLALGSVTASAQSGDTSAPLSLRLDTLPGNALRANGLAASPALTQIGLHVDSGAWRFDLALPDSSIVPRLALGPRQDRSVPTEFNLGISRSLGSALSAGSFWDTANLSLVANAGYATAFAGADDNPRSLWSGGVGAAWRFSPASSLGLNYRIESNPLAEGAAARSLGLSYGYQFTSGLRLNTSLGRGLSDGAPKWGGGLSISFSH